MCVCVCVCVCVCSCVCVFISRRVYMRVLGRYLRRNFIGDVTNDNNVMVAVLYADAYTRRIWPIQRSANGEALVSTNRLIIQLLV